jgi:hypothetical protein
MTEFHGPNACTELLGGPTISKQEEFHGDESSAAIIEISAWWSHSMRKRDTWTITDASMACFEVLGRVDELDFENVAQRITHSKQPHIGH